MKHAIKSIGSFALFICIISGLLFLFILVSQEKPDFCFIGEDASDAASCSREVFDAQANERKPYWITFLISGSVFYLSRQFAQVHEKDNEEKSNN